MPLPSATNSLLTLVGVKPGDASAYDCVITNIAGSVTSPAANLTVNLPPTLGATLRPEMSLTANSVTFRVNPSGTPPFTFQWRKAGVPISGATAASWTIGASELQDPASYDCVITNVGGSIETEKVAVPLRITAQPKAQLIPAGGPLNLGVQATATGPIQYQWFRNGAPISGANGSSLQKLSTSPEDNGRYFVQLTLEPLTLRSEEVMVEQVLANLAMTPAVGATLVVGGSSTLSVEVTNGAFLAERQIPLTYSWTLNGKSLSGAASSTLQLQNIQPSGAGVYEVTVRAGTFGTSSAKAVVQVADIGIIEQPQSAQVLLGGEVRLKVVPLAPEGVQVSYQWRKGGLAIPSATGSTYTISNLTDSDVAAYDVEITAGPARVVSQTATVGLLKPVVLDTAQFARQARLLNPGQPLSLRVVTTSGSDPLAYQWYRDAQLLPSETKAFLTLPAIRPEDAGLYSVRVSNAATPVPVDSGTVQVRVNSLPPAGAVSFSLEGGPVTQGSRVDVTPGQSVQLFVSLPDSVDKENLAYTWRRNGVAIPNENKATLVLGSLKSTDKEGVYDVVVRNTIGSVLWRPLEVALTERPLIRQSDLLPLTVLSGSDLKWSAFVVNPVTPSVRFNWQRDGKPVVGGTAAVLEIRGVSKAEHAGVYTVSGSNSFSVVSSSAARLTVIDRAQIAGLIAGGTYNLGQPVKFEVETSGDAVQIQWQRDGQVIPGATGNAFTLPSISPADAASKYSVRVFNEDPLTHRILSSETRVVPAVALRSPVSFGELALGGANANLLKKDQVVTLNVPVFGTGPFQFQWRKDGAPILSASGTIQNPGPLTYTVPPAGESTKGRYDVLVTNMVGAVVSPSVDLGLRVPVSITQHPQGRAANSGTPVTLVVGVGGTGPFTFQWSKDGQALPFANGPTYTIPSLSDADEGTYAVSVSDEDGAAATSNRATVVLNDDVTIVSQPESPAPILLDATQSRGPLTLSIGAVTKGRALRYQWRKDGKIIPGAVSSVYRLEKVTLSDAGAYDVLVSSGGSAVASEPATVTVFAPLAVRLKPENGHPEAVAAKASVSKLVRLEASATTSGDLTYRWFRNGEAYAEGSTIEVEAEEERAFYRVEATLSYDSKPVGTVSSKEVPVQLMAPASITTNPSSATVEAGKRAAFLVDGVGGGSLTFTWEKLRSGRWEPVAGATGKEFKLNTTRLSDAGSYRAVVANARNAATAEVSLVVREAEVISKQPVAQTINAGDSAVLEVEAKGVDLSYQWRRNGVPIGGASAAGYTVTEAGLYDVLVKHAFGSSLSESVRVTVRQPVKIVRSPANASMRSGTQATLFVTATGTEPISYQWRKDGALIGGETSAQVVVTSAGVYDVVVTNPAGSTVSDTAVVTIPDPVEIKVQPAAALVSRPGESVQFSAVAAGTPPEGQTALTYQWKHWNGEIWADVENGAGISGAQTNTLRIAGVQPLTANSAGSAGMYRLDVTGQLNTLSTVPSQLTVFSPPSITRHPSKAVVKLPGMAVFSVAVVGTPPFTYKWFENGIAMTNPKVTDSGSRLVVNADAAAFDGRQYSVEVHNDYGTVTSDAAKLSVVSARLGVAFSELDAATDESKRVKVVAKGGTFSLTATPIVVEEGTRLAYQWRRDGIDISGATAKTLTLRPVAKEFAGLYDVSVRLLVDTPEGENDGVELARGTQPGTLLVVDGGPVVQPFGEQSFRPGQSFSLAPVVQVLDPVTRTLVPAPATGVTFQWRKDGVAVAGGVSVAGVLSVSQASSTDSGVYSVVASYGGISGDPVSAKVTVEPALKVSVTVAQAAASGNPLAGTQAEPLELVPRSRLNLSATVLKGDGPFKYQWRLNGSNLLGGTADRYTVPSVLARNAGRYDVVVTGATERVVSDSIYVRLRDPLTITAQPQVLTVVNPGSKVSIPVGLNTSDASFQWFKGTGANSVAVPGQTTNVLTISAVQESDDASYRLVISGSNGLGRLVSNVAKIVVNKPVRITSSPVSPSGSLVPGKAASFRVTASGTGPLTYQWTRDGVPIPGANSDQFILPAVSVSDAGAYRAVVRSPVNTDGVASDPAILVVSLPVSITRQPEDQTLAVGDKPPVLLSVDANGDGVLTYQWRRNGLNITGGTQAALLLPKGVGFYDAGNYDVLIANTVGGIPVSRVVSRVASVRVNGNPPEDGGAPITDGWRANEGETVMFPCYGESANWSRIGSGSLSFDLERTKGITGSAVLTLRNVKPVDAGTYAAALLSNGTLNGKTVKWILDVVPVPVIDKDPVDVKVLPGGKTLVSAGLTVTKDTRLQWLFQSANDAPWVAIPGATNNTYDILNASARDGGYYRLEVSNSAGTVTSRSARVTVYEPVGVSASMLVGTTVQGGSLVNGRISGGTIQPGALTAANADPGTSVTLMATPTGDLIDPVETAYQWYRLSSTKAWAAINGAVSSTLTIPAVQEADDVFYRVRAFGKVNGGVDSTPIRLTVNDPVAIKAGQSSKTIALVQGDTTVLSVIASGTDVHYQWTRDGEPVGTDSASYTISHASALDAGTYGVIVRNRFSRAGAVASSTAEPMPQTAPFEIARVSVKGAPSLQPLAFVSAAAFSATAQEASTAELAMVEEGKPFALGVTLSTPTALPLTYQWRRNGVLLAGKSGRLTSLPAGLNDIRLSVSAATAESAGVYDVVVSNLFGATVSSAIRISVDLNPFITRQPADALASEGGSATFRVESLGSGLTYRWLLGNTANFADADGIVIGTDSVLTFEGLKAAMNGKYVRVIVTKGAAAGAPSVKSRTARIDVTQPGDLTIADLQFADLTSDGVALLGSSIKLSAMVKGSGVLTYRWRKDGADIVGALGSGSVQSGTSIELPITTANASAGVYDLLLTNGADIAYGKPVSLAVDPFVESFEVPATANPGDGLRFQAKVSSPSKKTLKYQWLYRAKGATAWQTLTDNNARISGSASDVMILKDASAKDSGTYRVEVRYADGSAPSLVVSREADVAISNLSITTQPKSLVLEEGASGSLTVVAVDATTYRWMKDGVTIPEATGSTLLIQAGTSSDGTFASAGLYQVEVSNSSGAVLSSVASVTVKAGLHVDIEAPSEAVLGSSINLTASISGAGPFTVAWTKDGKSIGSEARYRIAPAILSDTGLYRVLVTDASGKTASAEMHLSIRNVPEILVGPVTQSVSATGNTKLFVVARFNGPLKYQWFKNGSALAGATTPQCPVAGAGISEAGDAYTIRVSSASDASAYAEASAKVSKRKTSSTDVGSASEGGTTLGEVTQAQWWIYGAQASQRTWTAAGARDTSGDQLGYWIVERVENPTTGQVRAGRTAWVWSNQTDVWTADTQTAQEVMDTARGEFSIVASRMASDAALQTFVVSGRFEAGTEAASYGAPEILYGESMDSKEYDLELTWDATQTSAFRLLEAPTLEGIVDVLKADLLLGLSPAQAE